MTESARRQGKLKKSVESPAALGELWKGEARVTAWSADPVKARGNQTNQRWEG